MVAIKLQVTQRHLETIGFNHQENTAQFLRVARVDWIPLLTQISTVREALPLAAKMHQVLFQETK